MNIFVRHKPDEAHKNIIIWKAEIAFMKDEVSFFQDLLDKHFVAMSAGEQMGNLAGLITELNALNSNDLKWLTERLLMLDNAVINQTEWQDEYSKDRYAECGKRMQDLQIQFKSLKSRIFQVVGSVIKKD